MINRLIDQVTERLSHDSLIRDIWLDEIIDHTKHMSQQVNRYPDLFTAVLGGNDVLLDTPLCLWVIIGLWFTASTVVTYRVTHKSPLESCISTRLITSLIELFSMRDCKLNGLIYTFILAISIGSRNVFDTHFGKSLCPNRTSTEAPVDPPVGGRSWLLLTF